MSVIAWDGKSIAADKQATCAGLRFKATKLRKLPTGAVIGWTGDQDSGEAMAKWYADGADPSKWPAFQDKETWVRLIVATVDGVRVFERQPVAIRVEDTFMAWGAGRDYALAAMRCGKTAAEACAVAMEFEATCGLGIDVEPLQ